MEGRRNWPAKVVSWPPYLCYGVCMLAYTCTHTQSHTHTCTCTHVYTPNNNKLKNLKTWSIIFSFVIRFLLGKSTWIKQSTNFIWVCNYNHLKLIWSRKGNETIAVFQIVLSYYIPFLFFFSNSINFFLVSSQFYVKEAFLWAVIAKLKLKAWVDFSSSLTQSSMKLRFSVQWAIFHLKMVA